MKMLKIFPLLAVFMGLIPSCRCPEVDPFFMPKEIAVKSIWENSLYDDFEDLVIEEAEGFELWIEFSEVEFLVERTPSMSFTNKLMATQPCPEDGHQGLKSEIESIEITSSMEFQDIESGQSLNQFFHVMKYAQDAPDEIVPVENVLENLNSITPLYTDIPVRLSALPGNNLVHSFTVELTFEDGSSVSGISSEVQF